METIKLRRIFADSYLHEMSFGLRILPQLALGRYDAVHSMMPLDGLAAIMSRRLGGHVCLYDEMGIPWRAWWGAQRDGWARRLLVRHVNVYGCMSDFALEVLRSDWGRNGDLLPGGVRLADFLPANAREPVPTILFSGLLDDPRKGLGDLLEAVAILSATEGELKVWLSGPGDPGPILSRAPKAAVDRLEHLPIGSPTDQGGRYARAWVTCLPSVSESFGLVLVESLASGTPIVVVNDAAPPSFVTPRTGAIAIPHDAQSLAGSLLQAFELSRRPETAAACRASAERFDWDTAIAPLLEGLYLRGRQR